MAGGREAGRGFGAFYIHRHKGTIGAVRRVVEPLGYLINVIEWFHTDGADPPGTFRLDIGVLETGITEEMYQEMERLIADAKPLSRHLIGLNILQDIPGFTPARPPLMAMLLPFTPDKRKS